MLEEVLSNVIEYTDDLLLDCIENEDSIKNVIVHLTNICDKIYQKKINPSKESKKVLVSYTLMVIQTPEAFFETSSKGESISITMGRITEIGHGFLRVILTEGRELIEKDLLLLLIAVPKSIVKYVPQTPALEANGLLDCISICSMLVDQEQAIEVLENREVWGLPEENDSDKLEEWTKMFIDKEYRKRTGMDHSNQMYNSFLIRIIHTAGFCYLNEIEMYSEPMHNYFINMGMTIPVQQRQIDKTTDEVYKLVKKIIIKSPKIKNNFIEMLYATYEHNVDKKKNEYNKRKTVDTSTILILSNVLSRFIMPVVNLPAKLKEIPIDMISRCKYIAKKEMAAVEGFVKDTPGDIMNEKFIAHLFYAKVLINQISYTPLVMAYNNGKDEKKAINHRLLTARGEDRTMLTTNLRILDKHLEYLKGAIKAPASLNIELTVSMYIVEYIRYVMHQKEFNNFPMFIIEEVLLWIKCIVNNEMTNIDPYTDKLNGIASVSTITSFCCEILEHPEININYKQLSVKMVSMFVYYIQNQRGVIRCLVKYYIDIQTVIKNSMERLNERIIISCCIGTLLDKYEFKQSMKDLLNEENAGSPTEHMSTKTAFLIHLVGSCTEAQEKGIGEIKKIADLEKRLETATGTEAEEINGEIESALSYSNIYFSMVKDIEKLLFQLIDLCSRAFLHSLILPRLAAMLNYSLITLRGKNAQNLNIKNKSKSGFNPLNQLAACLRMYVSIKSKAFVVAVLQDNGLFKSDLFQKAVDTCVSKRVITQGEHAQCTLFLKRIENIQATQTEEQEIEYPDHFIDPLTFSVMTDPVILTTSNTKINRSTATMILVNDPIDPFTRQPLTENDIVEDKELKQEIAEFMAKHKIN
ncbi:ubiquitin conjugation factor E4 B [Nematocida sp. AWRm80]|nr:ubiquitin conjugation factor E4 B [Nematocida sp. AWRm80]